MKKYYSGKFTPKNPSKYTGDVSNICYRSHWEMQAFKWLDNNPGIKCWSSEEVSIPYICKTDGKRHTYYIDLKMTLTDGRTYLVEIKPASQTVPPKTQKRKTPRYITEVLQYVKNVSKWEAASEYATDQGMIFQVWTEETLKNLGIKLLT